MRWSDIRLVILLIMAAWLASLLVERLSGEEVIGPAIALDGDSLRVLDRELRLKGIDAPELSQTCRAGGGEAPCGRESREALASLAGRGLLHCRLSGRDRFRRDLAVCRAGDVDVNAAMVRQGRALAFGAYESEEREARAARRGLWATQFERPADYRAKHPRPFSR